MSKEQINDTAQVLVGTVSALGIGSFLFEAVGALILGVMGAAGGYIFTFYIKPHIKPIIEKIKQKIKQRKAR